MPKKDRNPGYVTASECRMISGGIMKNLDTITKALTGEDMRGGMVKDIADMKADLKQNIDNNNGGMSKRDRVTIYSSAIISTGLVVAKVIEYFM